MPMRAAQPGKECVFGLQRYHHRSVQGGAVSALWPALASATIAREQLDKIEQGYLESPRPFKNGSLIPVFCVMTPFFKGHGDSRYNMDNAIQQLTVV